MKTTIRNSAAAMLFAIATMTTVPAHAADCPQATAAPASETKAPSQKATVNQDRVWFEMYGGA